MTALVLAAFFVFVLAAVAAGALFYQRWQGEATPAAAATAGTGVTAALADPHGGEAGTLESLLALLGGSLSRRKDENLRRQLFRAGYRAPSALATFHGAQLACGLAVAIILAWSSAFSQGGSIFLALVCGLGFGFLAPKRYLEYHVRRRALLLRAALPPALDLMVLALEAGQSLDQAMQEAARSLRRVYPDLAAEFTFCALEMRAGTPRSESLRRMGERCGEDEIRKMVAVLIDGERFGSSLGPALRTHAHYLRTRMRQRAQESARKLSVKLVLPVFFLIFPSVLLVTLAPAYLQLRQFLGKLIE